MILKIYFMNKKSIISLIRELKTFLKEKRKLSYEDPSINPVSSLAHLLSRKFVNNEIDFPKINSIIEHLSQELILQRASNLNKNNSFNIKKRKVPQYKFTNKDIHVYEIYFVYRVIFQREFLDAMSLFFHRAFL